ncbi:MAG: hypothetical protein ABR956_06855 [Terracidiphilus sp.]
MFNIVLSGVTLITAYRSGALARFRPLRSLTLVPFAFILTMVAGCGGMTRPQIGPIQFTTAAGANVPPVGSLAVNGQVYMIADVTDDDQFLGVTWSVSCGSQAPAGGVSIDTSCGTFDPVQTLSGPVPAYTFTGIVTTYNAPSAIPKGTSVTITAHATALPSVTSSVTITIVAAEATLEPEATKAGSALRLRLADLTSATPVSVARGKARNSEL